MSDLKMPRLYKQLLRTVRREDVKTVLGYKFMNEAMCEDIVHTILSKYYYVETTRTFNRLKAIESSGVDSMNTESVIVRSTLSKESFTDGIEGSIFTNIFRHNNLVLINSYFQDLYFSHTYKLIREYEDEDVKNLYKRICDKFDLKAKMQHQVEEILSPGKFTYRDFDFILMKEVDDLRNPFDFYIIRFKCLPQSSNPHLISIDAKALICEKTGEVNMYLNPLFNFEIKYKEYKFDLNEGDEK